MITAGVGVSVGLGLSVAVGRGVQVAVASYDGVGVSVTSFCAVTGKWVLVGGGVGEDSSLWATHPAAQAITPSSMNATVNARA
jgi:hypothetical protein